MSMVLMDDKKGAEGPSEVAVQSGGFTRTWIHFWGLGLGWNQGSYRILQIKVPFSYLLFYTGKGEKRIGQRIGSK
jgi:hypothetical protein